MPAIAIVGAACRLPGAPDLDAYWSLLAAGRDAVTQIPADRFTQAAHLHPRRGEPGVRSTSPPARLAMSAASMPPPSASPRVRRRRWTRQQRRWR